MSSFSEVEKLERRYQDNPHGLTFAPLAEYYRKSGDVPRALELTRRGLELHPDYIPASIVLGRCHLDLGETREAEAAFSHVLALDPENVIALKALADIAERDGRPGEAERWLNLLLSVDRSNEDAREQLARVQAAASPEAVEAASADPAADPAEEVGFAPLPLPGLEPTAPRTFAAAMEQAIAGDTDEYAVPPTAAPDAPPAEPAPAAELEIEPLTMAEPAPQVEPMPEPGFASVSDGEEPVAWVSSAGDAASAEAMPLVLDDLTPAEPVARDESLIAEETETLSAEVQPLEGLVGAQDPREREEAVSILPEEEAPAVPDDAMGPVDPDLIHERTPDDDAFELAVEREEEIVLQGSAGSQYQTHDAAAELGAGVELDAPADDPFAPIAPPIEREEAAAEQEEGPELAEEVPEPAEALQAAEAGEPIATEELAVAEEPVAAGSEPDTAPEPWHAEPVAMVEPEPEDEAEALAEGELPEGPVVVTESMAALYLQQGHRAEALDVYRQLLAQRPGDPQLEKRVAGLEAELAAEAASAAEPEPAEPEAPQYAAARTGGQSVGDFLRGVLGHAGAVVASAAPTPAASTAPQAEPQPQPQPDSPANALTPDAAPTAAPTRPAHDPLSLSSVFGEEPAPAPPAPAADSGTAGLSFDEFFGAGKSMPADATRTTRPARPQAEDDDLDQFQNWLQNLKR